MKASEEDVIDLYIIICVLFSIAEAVVTNVKYNWKDKECVAFVYIYP